MAGGEERHYSDLGVFIMADLLVIVFVLMVLASVWDFIQKYFFWLVLGVSCLVLISIVHRCAKANKRAKERKSLKESLKREEQEREELRARSELVLHTFETLTSTCSDFDYERQRDAVMYKLFATSEHNISLRISSEADVENFGGFASLSLFSKYFGLFSTRENCAILSDFIISTERMLQDMESALVTTYPDLTVDIIEVYLEHLGVLPKFTLYTKSRHKKDAESIITRTKTVSFSRGVLCSLELQLNKAIGQNTFARQQRNEMTPELREAVLRRDNYTCCKCGNSRYEEPSLLLEVDHIVPIKAGGRTTLDNLQTLCWRCNRSKSSKVE